MFECDSSPHHLPSEIILHQGEYAIDILTAITEFIM